MGKFSSPVMSDKTLLVSVEDLISMAMGSPHKNKVNYKLIQTVLHILASQMRMLEQRVEIRIAEKPPETSRKSPRKVETSTTDGNSGQSPRQTIKERKEEQARMHAEKAERAAIKDMERRTKAAQKEQEKASRAASKERKREENFAKKEREREERAASKDREKAAKEKRKDEWAALRDEERESTSTESDQENQRAASKERKNIKNAAAKIERPASEDREKTGKASAKDAKAIEKDKKRAEKAAAKDKQAVKESESIKEAADQDRESAKKAAAADEKGSAKGKGKDEKVTAKEQERKEKAVPKADKQDQRDKGKATKEKDEAAKIGQKDRDWIEKAQEKVAAESIKGSKIDKGKLQKESATSIAVTDARSRGSIEVVTRSQFELLAARVTELAKKSGPLPMPVLPDNEKLRSDLAKGTASLTDAMQAMHVSARVQAAEQAVSRMAGLLTQLAAAGALPEDIASKVLDVRQDLEPTGTVEREIDEKAEERKVAAVTLATSKASGARSVSSRVSTGSGVAGLRVTHSEMDTQLQNLKEELKQNVHQITAKTVTAADTAAFIAKSVADKMDTAMQLDSRISKLHSLTAAYAEQLSGLDAGLSTQMQGFQELMGQMKSDLTQGLAQLELVNMLLTAETAAVVELTERYEGLVSELEHTLQAHSALTGRQRELADELHVLLESVEMLREQKADRDEMQDGLRDKADNSRLAGLLTEQAFEVARSELEDRLELCHEKFRRQELAWMNAVKDINETMNTKAELIQLMGLREDVQQLLNELNERCTLLAQALGDPKAALMTRLVSRGAVCGACMVPALMEPVDACSGTPAPLPAMRPRRLEPAEEPCIPEWRVPAAADDRAHACHRWVGGSHTLLSPVVRRRAGPIEGAPVPTNKYTGYGDDGRMYLMEEKLRPCVECNPLPDGDSVLKDGPPPSEDGAGDRAMINEITTPEPDRKEIKATDGTQGISRSST